jgi:hypothetical protein
MWHLLFCSLGPLIRQASWHACHRAASLPERSGIARTKQVRPLSCSQPRQPRARVACACLLPASGTSSHLPPSSFSSPLPDGPHHPMNEVSIELGLRHRYAPRRLPQPIGRARRLHVARSAVGRPPPTPALLEPLRLARWRRACWLRCWHWRCCLPRGAPTRPAREVQRKQGQASKTAFRPRPRIPAPVLGRARRLMGPAAREVPRGAAHCCLPHCNVGLGAASRRRRGAGGPAAAGPRAAYIIRLASAVLARNRSKNLRLLTTATRRAGAGPSGTKLFKQVADCGCKHAGASQQWRSGLV